MNRLRADVRNMGVRQNVCIQVLDADTNRVVQQHVGHNSATDSMIRGIGHYLKGDGVFSQGIHMLSHYVPRYISLGTMGLINQDQDDLGLPAGIGTAPGTEEVRFNSYMLQTPGYGADGYDLSQNNGRPYAGLGPKFISSPVNCELISDTFPRAEISMREILPETEAELPKTIDVIFSAMVSLGAMRQFRAGKDYVFITEAGLWSRPDWSDGADNGLLAGYRIIPPNKANWPMNSVWQNFEQPDGSIIQRKVNQNTQENRDKLKTHILRVGKNQVVLVIWKIQIGAIEQLFPEVV